MFNGEKLKKRTFDLLDEAYENSLKLPFDINNDRYIIVSDVHKADKVKWIDDFQRNEMVYCYALQNYLDNEYRLVLNGDIEECWEAKPRSIINSYKDTTYALEKLFADKGKDFHVRIYGNHDDLWSKPEKVKKHLWPVLGQIDVHQGLRLGDNIFIVHGHQGEFFSDAYSWISRHMVRHGWRWAQKLLRVSTSRAAVNNLIRDLREEIWYEWAEKRKLLLVTGHSHRPMFRSYGRVNQLHPILENIEETIENSPNPYLARATANYLRDKIGKSKKLGYTQQPVTKNPIPCFFNSGCCVHTNGITGLEIAGGEIRLIKWQLSEANSIIMEIDDFDASRLINIERKVFQRAKLEQVFGKILGKKSTLVPEVQMQTKMPEAKVIERVA